jgi:hypothetical protein
VVNFDELQGRLTQLSGHETVTTSPLLGDAKRAITVLLESAEKDKAAAREAFDGAAERFEQACAALRLIRSAHEALQVEEAGTAEPFLPAGMTVVVEGDGTSQNPYHSR